MYFHHMPRFKVIGAGNLAIQTLRFLDLGGNSNILS